jgi:hypothetical protein
LQALPISFAGIGVRDAIRCWCWGATVTELQALTPRRDLLEQIEHIVVGFLVLAALPARK